MIVIGASHFGPVAERYIARQACAVTSTAFKGMRKRILEKRLGALGWRFKGHGERHDPWTDGRITVPVPRHREVNERIAARILHAAEEAATQDGANDHLCSDPRIA